MRSLASIRSMQTGGRSGQSAANVKQQGWLHTSLAVQSNTRNCGLGGIGGQQFAGGQHTTLGLVYGRNCGDIGIDLLWGEGLSSTRYVMK